MLKALLFGLIAGKIGKFLVTAGTMLFSIVAYSFVFGWSYAVGLVGLIFAHEMGHYIAARQSNLDVGALCFIPFVGAWIQLKEQPMNAETEAFVGMAGPLMGSAAAFLCYLASQSSGSMLLLALAYSGFMLNLFNLIPITPLDGGRIVSVVSPKVWYAGIPILIGLFFWKPSPMLLVFAVLFIPKALESLRNKEFESSTYFVANRVTRISYAFQYLALTLFLSIEVFVIHGELPGATY